MKLYKATIYYYDANQDDNDTTEYLKVYLDRLDFNVELFDIKETKEIKWTDEIDLNDYGHGKKVYENYFKGDER